jgi:Cu2+-exporting ATPase
VVAEIGIRNVYDASEYACLERCLRGLAGVTDVHLDRTRGVAHLSYDASQTSPEKIQSDAERLGCSCDCQAQNRMPDILVSAARTAHRRTSIMPR